MRLERHQPPPDSVAPLAGIVPPRALPAETEHEETFCAAYLRVHDRALNYAQRFLSRMEAEDALGEATLKAWRNWAKLRPEQRTYAYFLSAVRTCVVDTLKASRRWVSLEDAEEQLDARAVGESEAVTRATTADEVIDLTVAAMPPQRREVFLLIREEQFTYKEVASTLRVSEGTVNSHYHYAMADLRTALSRKAFRIDVEGRGRHRLRPSSDTPSSTGEASDD